MAKNIAMIAGNMNDSNKSIGALLTDDIIATNNGRIKKIKINFGCNQYWSVLGFFTYNMGRVANEPVGPIEDPTAS